MDSEARSRRPVPRIGPDTEGFWEATRNGALALRACRPCNRFLHLPREFCKHCGGRDLEWRHVSGKAHLYSWSTVRHQVHPGFPVPYTIFLVELDDAPGVRLASSMDGEVEARAGMPMELYFERINDEITLPQFRPAETAAG